MGKPPTEGVASPLVAGHYKGSGECNILVQVELQEPVSEVVPLALDVLVNDDGQPVRDGLSYETGSRVDLQLGRFAIWLTVTGTNSTADLFVVNVAAELTMDQETPFPIQMDGDAAETYTPDSEDSTAYAFAAELVDRETTGTALARSMAVQCAATLLRQ